MISGIKEILIITTPHDNKSFKKLLGDGSDFGCRFEYAIQNAPNGLAEAFIIGEDFIGKDKVVLILGDNIFYGRGLGKILRNQLSFDGASIFAVKVRDPNRYGIVEFKNNEILSIEEKPSKPKSNYAIPGLYFYDNNVIEFAKKVKPSDRGEKEITSLNQMYLNNKMLNLVVLDRGVTWFDTGTVESMVDASEFVRVIEERTNSKIACLEEIAYRHVFINKKQLLTLAARYGKSKYGIYLQRISKSKF